MKMAVCCLVGNFLQTCFLGLLIVIHQKWGQRGKGEHSMFFFFLTEQGLGDRCLFLGKQKEKCESALSYLPCLTIVSLRIAVGTCSGWWLGKATRGQVIREGSEESTETGMEWGALWQGEEKAAAGVLLQSWG